MMSHAKKRFEVGLVKNVNEIDTGINTRWLMKLSKGIK